MPQFRTDGNEAEHFFLAAGGSSENVFQNRQFTEKRHSDGLFRFGFTDIAGDQAFDSGTHGNGSGFRCAFIKFVAVIVAFHYVPGCQFIAEIQRPVHIIFFRTGETSGFGIGGSAEGNDRRLDLECQQVVGGSLHGTGEFFTLDQILESGSKLQFGILSGNQSQRGAGGDFGFAVLLQHPDERQVERRGEHEEPVRSEGMF